MFFSILKNEFMSLLTSNHMFDAKKGKIKKPIALIGSAVLFSLLFGYISLTYSVMLAHSFIPYGAINLLPLMIYVSGCMVVFFYGALKSSSVLFSFNDFDMLMSMPIPSKTVITAKLAYLYISDLGFALMIMLPALGVWVYYAQPEIISIVLILISLVFVPVIPLALATIVGTLVAYITGFSKHKALMNIFANLILVGGVMFASVYFSSAAAQGADLSNITMAMTSQLVAQFPPAKLFSGIIAGDIVAFLLFIAFSVLIAYVFILLIASKFIAIHSKLASATVAKTNKQVKLTNQGSFIALVKKEFKMFFAIPVYIINMGVGCLMCLGGVAYLVFFGRDMIDMLLSTPMAEMLLYNGPLAIAILVVLTSTTCCSTSLEGKSLWILKNLPVSAKSVFMAKVVFNLCLVLPTVLISSLAFIYLCKPSFTMSILVILFPVSCCFLSTLVGLALNLKYPNFDWVSEVKIVKQSMPMLILTFGAMAFGAGMYALINIVASTGFMVTVIYSVLTFICVAVSTAIYLYIDKNAENILISL